MTTRPTLAVLAVLAVAGVAIAQQAARPKLHEDLEGPTGDRPTPLIGQTGSGSPAAIAAGDKVLPKPAVERPDKATKGEPVLGEPGFAADRQTSMTPDSSTGPDGTLHYVSVFNPDVLPFKRMSSFDSVGTDYTLVVGRTALSGISVGGTTDKTRDRFWGSVLIKLSPGVDVPLPSVAPDMRILSYEASPKARLEFSKDGADNFFVRSDESSASGTIRLVFLADADAGYFAPSLPTSGRYTSRTVAAMTPPELKPQVPDAQRRAAAITLEKLRVDADMELGVAFNKLVAYFRAFKEGALPRSSGDIYRDLCDTQLGVCRHRAFAFMVTANALGIPTRYVQNEAHAFVEVWFPERRWQRVDLGGAALRMEVTGADNKTLHRPRAEDPFAKPKQYENSYTQLEGDISGLSAQQLADKKQSLDQSPASGTFDGATGTGGGSGSAAPGPDRITPDPNLPAVTQDPAKQTPRLEITMADASAYRGDVLHVEARVTVGGRGLPDHPIDVYLSPAGRDGASPHPLGRAVTSADGTFRQDFSVPPGLGLTTYEIWLSSPQDAYFNAALSR
ncbi:MAG: transglutaminase domain-containing protein [Deltaproteobacteria bacterium]|nr:transglutaminase domain-containing protein [Deltaproteobacteria bacterium]MBA3821593.1 transglutaminase domain-containing protein [Deltaproteobacteria bacterium]